MKTETKKASTKKIYEISVLNLVIGKNPRNPLSEKLQEMGYDIGEVQGKTDIWALGTSQDQDKKLKFIELIQQYDPEIVALAQTLITQGQLEPIEVRDTGKGTYTLGFGHRRSLAVLFNWLMFGKPKEPIIEAVLMKGNNDTMFHRAIVENIRKQPSVIEEAKAIQYALNQGEKREALAEKLGVSTQTIANRLKLLELPTKKQEAIHTGALKASKALGVKKEEGASSGSPTKPKMLSRKEIESLQDEYAPHTPEWKVLNLVLGVKEEALPEGEVGVLVSIPNEILGFESSAEAIPESTPEPLVEESPPTQTE